MSNEDILQKEPIAAIATALGEAGLAVIRVSGKNCIAITDMVFEGANLERQSSHTVHYGHILRDGRKIDEVLVTVFRSPRSYTGEDSIEISCHGGVLVTQAVLEAVLDSGIRMARPGEFTQRAFLNGKMELSQAEAVADLIHAKSSKAVDAAGQQLEGVLGTYIHAFRQAIIDATAMVELELDFSEEDVEFANRDELKKLLRDLQERIIGLLDTYEAGRLVKNGIRTVIAGRPNAGKSTLLNTLVGSDRTIVTEIAGTTRDTVDVDWSHQGLLFRLTDTAGIRETADSIEAEGVRRSAKAIEEADLIVYLKDLTRQSDEEEMDYMAEQRRKLGRTFLCIGTKKDLAANGEREASWSDLSISALDNDGIDELKSLMKERALENKHYDASSLLITSSRHRDALQKTQKFIQSALRSLDEGVTGDLLSIDLRSALNELGTITGEITTEDLLDSIFSRFCIGK